MAKAKSQKQGEPCPHCRSGPEHYWYLGLFEFDVDLARQIVADGREPVEVDEDSVRQSVEESVIYPQHIDHVVTTYPGIIAHVRYLEPGGELHRGHVLIDGNHRAARCLRDNLPFYAHILSEEESERVMTLKPESTYSSAPTACEN